MTATLALAKRGLTMLRAKRVVEEMLASGRAVVEVPTVEDEDLLVGELADAGCTVARLEHAPVNVRDLRQRLGLTQEQFALRYGLEVDAVRNWEGNRRKPDVAAMAYLGVISRIPEQVSLALEKTLTPAREPDLAAGRMRAIAVAVVETLQPDRPADNRRFVNSLPEAKLGDVLRVAENILAQRDEATAETAPKVRAPA